MLMVGDAEEQGQHGADDRHRHADHDDERIAQAFELRRQHQEDDDQREAEGDRKLVAFLHILSGIRQVVVAEAGRQTSWPRPRGKSTACPTVTPGIGTAWKVAEFNWL